MDAPEGSKPWKRELIKIDAHQTATLYAYQNSKKFMHTKIAKLYAHQNSKNFMRIKTARNAAYKDTEPQYRIDAIA